MPVLLAHAIEDSTDIFGISEEGGFETPNRPPSVCHCLEPIQTLSSNVRGQSIKKPNFF